MPKEVFNNLYYDIEALNDIFSLCSYNEKDEVMDMYYLLDPSINGNKDFDATQEDIIRKEIRAKNKRYKCDVINFYNLYNEDANIKLAQTFGCSAPGYLPDKWNFRLVRDIDPDFDENIHPYMMGYNSLNYDQTILAMYFAEVFGPRDSFDKNGNSIGTAGNALRLNGVFLPTTSQKMRTYNDELFSPYFKPCMPDRLKCVYEYDPFKQKSFSVYKIGNEFLTNQDWNTDNPAYYIRRNQINSGRHIDVARLNEKQDKVGLKRLLGMKGLQILESDTDLSNRGNVVHMTFQDIVSLFAYNASDVLNLQKLFHDKNYVATFKLKKQMLVDYPELIFDQLEVEEEVPGETIQKWNKVTQKMETVPKTRIVKKYKPDCRPNKVKRNRLTINSSSAQMAAACLCPYGSLVDENCVSFVYPSAVKAKELGIPQVNVLDETVKFIETRLKPLVTTPEGQEIIDSLYKMVDMYRNIEGKDFNASHMDISDEICDLRKFSDKINVPYMGPDGKPSNCYVTFSVGGIHGAEYNKELYDANCEEYNQRVKLIEDIKAAYGSASNLLLTYDEKGKPKKRKTFELNGVEYEVKEFIASTCTLKDAQNGKAKFKASYENPKKPQLFPVDKDGKASLHKNYVVTSFGPTNHEDFTSYYPSMLINMSAFWNEGLGYDRYAEIFGNKEKFGKMMKDKSYSAEERALYSVMRNGTKLILNSASGAADVAYNTPIRMNNRITAMRIIGQLFTWRIGQAQSLEGAQVVSTNTDGLYTVFEETENAKILEREAEAIHVGIEPEPTYLVSKDANNRWEGTYNGQTGNSLVDITIDNASGGTLACMYGPDTTKALAHPAILDWALAEFLKWKALSGKLDNFNPEVGRFLLETVAPTVFVDDAKMPDRAKLLQMFQNVVASNPNKGTYIFGTKVPYDDKIEASLTPIAMQHYSRVFYVDPEKVPQAYKDNIVYCSTAYIREEQSDASPLAIQVIGTLNNNNEALATGTAKIKKVNGIEFNTPCIICNEDLELTTNIEVEWLDFDYYNKVLAGTYSKNWQNDVTPDENDDDVSEE